jgi:hypothetical protein
MRRVGAGAVIAVVWCAASSADFIQEGGRLVGTGAAGVASQGSSVALSADGNTAIVGGPYDNDSSGAAWVFTRSGGAWSQQGDKLVGSGAVAPSQQGWSVALSGDGNTAIVGGRSDNGGVGAAWVFTRTDGVWSQQGDKLVGTDVSGSEYFGTSVAISADGATAIVGGPSSGWFGGAAWVFTRAGGVWSQQGSKLAGDGTGLGAAVAISGDGNTAAVLALNANPFTGLDPTPNAVLVFTRTSGAWSQQGGPLVGDDAPGVYGHAGSVAISGDGNTVMIGRAGYNSYNAAAGAIWVFTRQAGGWSQQAAKLVGTGALGYAAQGCAVALSRDGNTAIAGGPNDDDGAGATWIFTRSGGAWWSQQGDKLIAEHDAASLAHQGTAVAISADGLTALVGGPSTNPGGAAWVFTASSFTVWVPVASHTSGLNGSEWRSDLGLLNPGTAPANVDLQFYGGSGLTGGTISLPAGAQTVMTDVVEQLGGSGSGAIQIVSDHPVTVASRTYSQISATARCYAGGTQGQDYPALSANHGLVAGQSGYLGGLTENASYRCNIGVVNLGAGDATVVVELFDSAGVSLASYAVPLAAGQWSQRTQPFRNVAGVTPIDHGYARVTVQSGLGVFALASVIDNITNDPTTVIVQQ